jgi:glycosyltransferase involved in cell wall biosynthesis
VRLLFLTAETWPTFRSDVAVLFAKYLPRFGVRSDLVAGRVDDGDSRKQWLGGEVWLGDVAGGRALKYIKTLIHGVGHVIRADPALYQAVQVRDMPVLGAIALIVARWKGIPLLYWMSYPLPEDQIALARERGLSAGLMKWLFPWLRGRIGRILLYRFVLPAARHVFVQSPRMKEDMVRRGVPAERMTPVPMGVDFEALRPEDIRAAEDPRLQGHRVLVYLGSLERPRRIEILFDMLHLVRAQDPKAVLALVGDTEDDVHRRWLADRAQAANVADCVIWTGWLPTREAWGYLKVAEVGLSPIPRGELLDCSSPTKLPEYLAFELPVVCNDNPDQAALMAAAGGGLCVPYTASDFAEAVCRLLSTDPATRAEMGRRGREQVCQTRDYAHIAQGLALTYADILGSDLAATD